MTSIFRLEAVRCYEPDDGHPYCDATTNILGHYSLLQKALEVIPLYAADTYDVDEIFAYIVKEIAVDGEIEEVRWLSVRSYDASGKLNDECLQNYNLVNQYTGRAASTIRFHKGEIVEVLCYDRLYPAIIAALPPTPEDKFPILDAEDDCYLVLPLDTDERNDHLHIPPTHVFPLHRKLSESDVDYLHKRLKQF